MNNWFGGVTQYNPLAGGYDGNGSPEPADIALTVKLWFTALSNRS